MGAAAKGYGVSPTTTQKWRGWQSVADAAMGPKEPRSMVLPPEDEAIIVAFRRHTLLPLDDGLYGLEPTIPHLTRSSLHRCLERHGISRLPEMEGDRPKKKRLADYPIGYMHIDIAEVRTEQGKLYLFVAIDRTSNLAFAKLEAEANRYTASDFLRALVAFVPYKIHTVLTDNGVRFCHAPRKRSGPTALYSRHMFDRVCHEHGIEHRLTKPNHPWTNGQVERMNRTIEDATVKRYHYETREQLRAHLQLFVDADNHARRLKILRSLTRPTSMSFRSGPKSPNASGSTRHTTSRDRTPKRGYASLCEIRSPYTSSGTGLSASVPIGFGSPPSDRHPRPPRHRKGVDGSTPFRSAQSIGVQKPVDWETSRGDEPVSPKGHRRGSESD